MHTKLHTENKFFGKGRAAKRPLRLHAPRTAILAGTKVSVRRKCEKRQLKINYPGSGNTSQFTYDAFGHTVEIVETLSGTVTSTKQFVRSDGSMNEARNSSGTVIAQYFNYGQTINGISYFYTKDRPLGSVREVADSSDNIQAEYSYDPYGRVTKLQGVLVSDIQYAGYYFDAPSGLNLTVNRAYNSGLGRWFSRDRIGEAGGANLYTYVRNNPILLNDPTGLCPYVPPVSQDPDFCEQDCAAKAVIRYYQDFDIHQCILDCLKKRQRDRPQDPYRPGPPPPYDGPTKPYPYPWGLPGRGDWADPFYGVPPGYPFGIWFPTPAP